MLHLRHFATAAFVLLPLAAPSLARADGPTSKTKTTSAEIEPAPPSKAKAESTEKPDTDSGAHLQGLELMVRPSFGSAGSASALHVASGARVVGDIPEVLNGGKPYGSMLGAGAEIGYRFHPIFSMGLHADFATIGATNPNDGTTELSRSRQSGGLYARTYPLALNESVRRYIDPWFSAGVSYVHDGQSFHHATATSTGAKVDGTWQLDNHAIGVPLAIGVDYRVTKAISIGPSFAYTIIAPIAGCAKLSAAGFQDSKLCTDNSGPQALAADSTGSWDVGLNVRFTPF